jgi:hypothetical protein
MPGILPMKVIKVGSNAQTRIAQAWYAIARNSRYSRYIWLLNSLLVIAVGQRKYDVTELDRMFEAT